MGKKRSVDGIERLDQVLARFEASSLEELSYEDADIEVTLRRAEPGPDWETSWSTDSTGAEGSVLAPISGELHVNEALLDATGPLSPGQLLGSVLTPEGGIELRAIGAVRLFPMWPSGTQVGAGDVLFSPDPTEPEPNLG